ncbi:MAG: hypothetical protein LC792_17490 [Actinobacteria bacterium]|nr:hypothetical protein [Actinomycetota bacterium]
MRLSTVEEVAWVAAEAATAVAELHAAGQRSGDLVHRISVTGGRVLLPVPLSDARLPAEDVAALGTLLEHLLASVPEPGPRPGAALLARHWPRRRTTGLLERREPRAALTALAARAQRAEADPRPTAAGFAAAVREAVPSPYPPGGQPVVLSQPGRGRPPDRRRRPSVIVLGAMTVVIVTLAGLVRYRPAPRASAATVPVPPMSYRDGVLTVAGAHYEVGEPGDIVAAGDWRCDGQPTLAVLRPTTGEVFLFDDWAGDEDVTARLVGRAPGGAALAPGRSCAEIEVRRAGAEPVRISARSRG